MSSTRARDSRALADHAVIGDLHTAALVDRWGRIDWLCLPRFDSPACFASLLGDETHGCWDLGPATGGPATERRYLPDSLVLEHVWDTPQGRLRVLDLMPPHDGGHDLVRIVECVSGQVPVRSTLRLRFDYGAAVPWVHREGDRLVAVCGPDAVTLAASEPMQGRDLSTVSAFTLGAGQRATFTLQHRRSHLPLPEPLDADDALRDTLAFWSAWTGSLQVAGRHRDAVVRSLISLKALTYEPTGGVVAAPTTGLPERLGGSRNWDYRYCWLRDSAFTLDALATGGCHAEAQAWLGWLLRAIGGDPGDLQIVYGIRGERSLPERELGHLPGYAGSRPVRVGNAASGQLQLDVYGEVLDTVARAVGHGVRPPPHVWSLLHHLLLTVERRWREPDAGIWEIRGAPRRHVHSVVMAWVAADRVVGLLDSGAMPAHTTDRARWARLREEIHADVCAHGVDVERGVFTQSYGGTALDASLLLLPVVGFLPADDPRVVATVEAVATDLRGPDGLVRRYRTDGGDGLAGGEGAFLACSFWLVQAWTLIGDTERAEELFDLLLGLRNDVGLLAEEYDPDTGRLVGNFPQALSHIPLVTAAVMLSGAGSGLD